jgi:flagellar biosynthesis protein FlhB
MAEALQDKTEAPTPRRREEARKEGQVGRSSDLPAAVVLLGALILLHVSGRHILGRLIDITRYCLETSDPTRLTAQAAGGVLGAALRETAGMVLPLMLVVFTAALVACFAQVGVLFTTAPLRPNIDKLNPVTGLSRMFNGRAVVHLLLGIAKMSLLGVLAYVTLKNRVNLLASAASMNQVTIVAVAAELVFTLGVRMAIALLILGIIDYIYQRYRTERDLRMTKEEVREELKRMEGDPMLKRRRREIAMQLTMQRIRSAVPKADVVVTNPTELAIALQYDDTHMTAPKVTAKGAGFIAQRIREIAIENGVPIVERKPLARALYKAVDVGHEVPAQFYKAIAEILAYVYELAGKRHRRRSETPVGVN